MSSRLQIQIVAHFYLYIVQVTYNWTVWHILVEQLSLYVKLIIPFPLVSLIWGVTWEMLGLGILPRHLFKSPLRWWKRRSYSLAFHDHITLTFHQLIQSFLCTPRAINFEEGSINFAYLLPSTVTGSKTPKHSLSLFCLIIFTFFTCIHICLF